MNSDELAFGIIIFDKCFGMEDRMKALHLQFTFK
jgi:hypothetical protein